MAHKLQLYWRWTVIWKSFFFIPFCATSGTELIHSRFKTLKLFLSILLLWLSLRLRIKWVPRRLQSRLEPEQNMALKCPSIFHHKLIPKHCVLSILGHLTQTHLLPATFGTGRQITQKSGQIHVNEPIQRIHNKTPSFHQCFGLFFTLKTYLKQD